MAFDLGLPWLPALMVACFGSCLVYAEIVGHVAHSDLTKNSPYFLGFTLFLFSLFVTFTRYEHQTDQLQMAFVIRQLGASLLTTVVGLPFRQWLFAYDPSQRDQEDFYHVLEEELRRSAGEFKKAQVELVGLVEQFVETRKTLFADEQNASDQYVSNLKRVVSLFDKTFSEYPHLISSALDSSTKAVENLQARLEAMAVAVASLDSSQLQQVEAELQKLKEQMVGLSDGVGSLTQSVGNLTSRSNDFPIAMGQMFNSASTIAAEGLSELHTQLRVLIKEVGDVDRLISDFVRLQTLKVVGR